jgi:hypothetical protein
MNLQTKRPPRSIDGSHLQQISSASVAPEITLVHVQSLKTEAGSAVLSSRYRSVKNLNVSGLDLPKQARRGEALSDEFDGRVLNPNGVELNQRASLGLIPDCGHIIQSFLKYGFSGTV